MILHIDPAQTDPDDIGAKQTTLEMDHEDAIEHVREVFTDARQETLSARRPRERFEESESKSESEYRLLDD